MASCRLASVKDLRLSCVHARTAAICTSWPSHSRCTEGLAPIPPCHLLTCHTCGHTTALAAAMSHSTPTSSSSTSSLCCFPHALLHLPAVFALALDLAATASEPLTTIVHTHIYGCIQQLHQLLSPPGQEQRQRRHTCCFHHLHLHLYHHAHRHCYNPLPHYLAATTQRGSAELCAWPGSCCPCACCRPRLGSAGTGPSSSAYLCCFCLCRATSLTSSM
jgi:hypothetical protein